MSKEKSIAIASLSPVDKAVYLTKRNQRSYWQKLSHKEWETFCGKMAEWFEDVAPDEWDDFIKANKDRKAKSDKEALIRAVEERSKK